MTVIGGYLVVPAAFLSFLYSLSIMPPVDDVGWPSNDVGLTVDR